ncbi:MAG: DUF6531 domain-containing protein, partial [Bdellovibrionaceae bacterium]|nr:DUF6531 domain-containing protein [Pseudobdellovibrionaceae bacterium]
MKYLLLTLLFILSFKSFAIVDTRSAGYSKTFIDFKTESLSYPLEIKRTYNSRSLYNGLFGFGWCSNLETRLTVLPDGMIKVVECGGGMEILYHPKGKTPDVDSYVNIILQKLKERKVRMSKESTEKLKKDLLKSQNLRANFLSALDIKGQAEKGLKYYAQGRVKEYIVLTSKGYVRYLPNDFKENFNKQGQLVKSSNKTGKIEISWSPKNIQVMNDRGQRLILSLNNKTGKAINAVYNNKTVARYTHRNQDLVKVLNSEGTFLHSYDSLHNLIKNTYPDKTTEELTYNLKKDWVIGFKDRRNCNEKYNYGVNKNNPDHYFSTVEKICARRIVNKSKYEFWHKTNKGGGKYLYRARARINGRIKTDVIYHPVFGTPVSFFKDGVRTKRQYYANGFLKMKDNPYQTVRYSKYNQKCRKPELVKIEYKNPNSRSKKKITRTEQINFNFDNKCQLFMAKKSEDEWIKIGHDEQGRMVSMEDQSRKKILLKWHASFNKPELIIREGVGTLRIVYDRTGEVTELRGL